jgi:predicted HTH domain antitoxin
VTIEVPDRAFGASKLTATEAKLDFAIGLYTGRRLSLGQAAKMGELSVPAFLQELGRRGICVNYSEADFAHDLQVIERVEAADDRR